MSDIIFVSAGTRVQSSSAATLTPTKPSLGNAKGGALLAVCQSKNFDVHSTATAGWTKLGQVNSGVGFTQSLWIASQTAANPVFTWASNAACAARIALYAHASNTLESSIGASTNNNGTTSTHSTSSINTTEDNSLVVYVDSAAANTALATPAGWTDNTDTGSSTDNGRTTFGSKLVPVAGSASGAISVTGANAAWVQWQVEMLNTISVGIDVSKIEVGAWLESPGDFEVSKIETAAWLDPPPKLETAKIEVAAWLDPPPKLETSKIEVGAWLEPGVTPPPSGNRRMSLM